MKNFLKIAEGVDVMPLLLSIQRQPDLWNRHTVRKTAPNTPHSQMSDIWIRYNDVSKYEETGNYSSFNDEHDPIWYPAYYKLPELRPIIFGLMARVEGERLGGVLITKIPKGCSIEPHSDKGWHVEYYDKFYVSLKNNPGSVFYCEDEHISPNAGEVYWFDNRKEHWVKNNSDDDRITLIVCIKTHRYGEKNVRRS